MSQDGVSFPYRDQARPFDLNSENVLEAFNAFAFTPFIVLRTVVAHSRSGHRAPPV
jgi:hypothetical protein